MILPTISYNPLRLEIAKKELEYKDRDGFWDLVLVNNDLDQTYNALKQFLLEHYPTLKNCSSC